MLSAKCQTLYLGLNVCQTASPQFSKTWSCTSFTVGTSVQDIIVPKAVLRNIKHEHCLQLLSTIYKTQILYEVLINESKWYKTVSFKRLASYYLLNSPSNTNSKHSTRHCIKALKPARLSSVLNVFKHSYQRTTCWSLTSYLHLMQRFP